LDDYEQSGYEDAQKAISEGDTIQMLISFKALKFND
jgi:hypothetical protein